MSGPEQVNLYEPPRVGQVHVPQAPSEFRPAPCPQCGGTSIQPSPYSSWRGRRAPRAVQDVFCEDCNCNFDGETGIVYPPRKSPLPWFLLALLAAMTYFGFIAYTVLRAAAAL